MAEDREENANTFSECPECGGELSYPTATDVLCQDCETMFIHEIRHRRHLLWRFTVEDGMTEVVARE